MWLFLLFTCVLSTNHTFFQNDITESRRLDNIGLSLRCAVVKGGERTATCIPTTLPISISTYLDPSTNVRIYRGNWDEEQLYYGDLRLSDYTTLFCEDTDNVRTCDIEYSVVWPERQWESSEELSFLSPPPSQYPGTIRSNYILSSESLVLSNEQIEAQQIEMSSWRIHWFVTGQLTRRTKKGDEVSRLQISSPYGSRPLVVIFRNYQNSANPLTWDWYMFDPDYIQLLIPDKRDKHQLIPKLDCEFTEAGLVIPSTCSVTLFYACYTTDYSLNDGSRLYMNEYKGSDELY
jgi:hypothetical protein